MPSERERFRTLQSNGTNLGSFSRMQKWSMDVERFFFRFKTFEMDWPFIIGLLVIAGGGCLLSEKFAGEDKRVKAEKKSRTKVHLQSL
jgi:hypothetical protein